jgi:hypothetical protein
MDNRAQEVNRRVLPYAVLKGEDESGGTLTILLNCEHSVLAQWVDNRPVGKYYDGEFVGEPTTTYLYEADSVDLPWHGNTALLDRLVKLLERCGLDYEELKREAREDIRRGSGP